MHRLKTGALLFGFVLSACAASWAADAEEALIRAGEQDKWFYVDRREVTLAEMQAYDSSFEAPYEYFEEAQMPATGVSFAKAQAYCRAQGKRLPSLDEWQLVCAGPEGYAYSYGNSWEPTLARMGRRVWTDGPKPVGSYEPNGYGLYDMVGNVWEWVDDGENEDDAHHVVGGSWVDGPRKTRCTVKHPVFDAHQRVINYGLRCARSLTEADLSRLAEEEAAKLRKIRAVARREAAKTRAAQEAREAARKAKVDAEARKVLEVEEADRAALEAEKARQAEAFARIVADMVQVGRGSVVAFYIDRDEVTVSEFRAFDSSYRSSEFSSGDRMPATDVTYEDADAYCRSQGKRLPTVEEWVAACMGGKGYLFSYGPRYDASLARTGHRWYAGADTAGAGLPAANEAVDLVGNVWEWVDGWHDESHALRALRGGAWMDGADRAKCTTETWARPAERQAHVGFRCAAGQD